MSERQYRLVVSLDGRRVDDWMPTNWAGILVDVAAFRRLQAERYLKAEAVAQVETREHGPAQWEGCG